MTTVRLTNKVQMTPVEINASGFQAEKDTVYFDGTNVYFPRPTTGGSFDFLVSISLVDYGSLVGGLAPQARWDGNDTWYFSDTAVTPGVGENWATAIGALTGGTVNYDDHVNNPAKTLSLTVTTITVNTDPSRLKIAKVTSVDGELVPNELILQTENAATGVLDTGYTKKHLHYSFHVKSNDRPLINELYITADRSDLTITNGGITTTGSNGISNLTDGDENNFTQWYNFAGNGYFYVSSTVPFSLTHIRYKTSIGLQSTVLSVDVKVSTDTNPDPSLASYEVLFPATNIARDGLGYANVDIGPPKKRAIAHVTSKDADDIRRLIQFDDVDTVVSALSDSGDHVLSVPDISTRDGLGLTGNQLVWVTDASADPNIGSLGAIYDFDVSTGLFNLFFREEAVNDIANSEW